MLNYLSIGKVCGCSSIGIETKGFHLSPLTCSMLPLTRLYIQVLSRRLRAQLVVKWKPCSLQTILSRGKCFCPSDICYKETLYRWASTPMQFQAYRGYVYWFRHTSTFSFRLTYCDLIFMHLDGHPRNFASIQSSKASRRQADRQVNGLRCDSCQRIIKPFRPRS